MDQEFSVLDNKIVGRNMYITRKIKDKKASEVADYLGISESAYTKYERGESQITVEIIQKVSESLKVDPMHIVASSHGDFIEITNSPAAGKNTNYTLDEKHTALLTKLIETQIAMNEKIMALLEKK